MKLSRYILQQVLHSHSLKTREPCMRADLHEISILHRSHYLLILDARKHSHSYHVDKNKVSNFEFFLNLLLL